MRPGPSLARFLLRLFGWRVVLAEPVPDRAVIVVYPHTSNWDFVVGILARFGMGLSIQWVGKDTLFRGPFGAFFRTLGGIPVNRRERMGLVAQQLAEFERRSVLRVVLVPEGTRAHTDGWKSGFYHLALAARMPVGLAFLDYGRRRAGVGAWLDLTGDPQADLARLRAFYADVRALRPASAGEIRFRDKELPKPR